MPPQASNSSPSNSNLSIRSGIGNSLSYPFTPKSQQQHGQREHRRDRSSPRVLGGVSSPIYEGDAAEEGFGAGGYGGGSDGYGSQSSMGDWESWVDDNASDGTGSVSTVGPEGTECLPRRCEVVRDSLEKSDKVGAGDGRLTCRSAVVCARQ